MLFCVTAQCTSQALNNMLDDAQTNRVAAVEKLIGAAGGKTVSVYNC